MRQLHVGSIHPTKKEVDLFYKDYKDSLPRQFNCVLLSHIQIPVKPDSSIIDSVKRVAETLIDVRVANDFGLPRNLRVNADDFETDF